MIVPQLGAAPVRRLAALQIAMVLTIAIFRHDSERDWVHLPPSEQVRRRQFGNQRNKHEARRLIQIAQSPIQMLLYTVYI